MRTSFFLSFFFLFVGCAGPKANPPNPPDAAPAAEPCRANQFVGCPSGEACARRQGKLIHTHACHDRAADACAAAGCVHGCDVYLGEPKEIHCAVNASSTGHMKKCGGFSNWGCPEDMTCFYDEEAKRADDAMGTCVPASGAAN